MSTTLVSTSCGRCFTFIARYQNQVLTADDKRYHKECFEAWYFGRHGKRPPLTMDKDYKNVYLIESLSVITRTEAAHAVRNGHHS